MKKTFVCKQCGKAHTGFFAPKWCTTPKCVSKEFVETTTEKSVVVVVVEPVTSTGSYSAHATLKYEFGVDAAGNKVERAWTPGLISGDGAGTHDGLRDGPSRSYYTKELKPGPWTVKTLQK